VTTSWRTTRRRSLAVSSSSLKGSNKYNLGMKLTNASDLRALPAGERILLTAHQLFYREGIRATGIDRVISEAGVTKVTFYRHFPSKNDLILAFLDYRHQRWMKWFSDTLQRHGGGLKALSPTLAEWFSNEDFRGCAFINSVAEVGPVLADVVKMTRRHKSDMTTAIAHLLPPSRYRRQNAQAISLAVDGAIVRATIDESPANALRALERVVKLLHTSQTKDKSQKSPPAAL